MVDLSIDEAKAKIWLDDVISELDDVEVVLKNVTKALTTPIQSEDTIMKGIYNVGTSMEDAWTSLCNDFAKSVSDVGEAIAQVGPVVIGLKDWLEAFIGKMTK